MIRKKGGGREGEEEKGGGILWEVKEGKGRERKTKREGEARGGGC